MKWSRWVTWLGAAVSVAGVVIGIWLQVAIRNDAFDNGSQRLDYAAVGVSIISAGALLAVAAQIMGLLQAAAKRQSST